MSKEQFKKHYLRFCHWQQAMPHYANRNEGEVKQCHNCGNEFVGNFCPICGQRAEVGRVGWKSIRENFAIILGLDSRSLTYTLLQLLGRPGYLVRDYISGHRQVSFPPINMLVIVCLFVVLFESVFHVENDVLGLKFNIQQLDEIVGWINAQKSWATLLLQSFYILPTWLVFRYAPGYPHHTLPEGFFLQVFLSVLSLLMVFIGYCNPTAELLVWLFFMYITYRQLFGYGWWGTLWRFAVILLLALITLVLVVVIVGYLYNNDGIYDVLSGILIVLSVATLLTAVILFVTHRINKYTYHHNNKEMHPH